MFICLSVLLFTIIYDTTYDTFIHVAAGDKKRYTHSCSVFCAVLLLTNLFRKHSCVAGLGTVLGLCLLSKRQSSSYSK